MSTGATRGAFIIVDGGRRRVVTAVHALTGDVTRLCDTWKAAWCTHITEDNARGSQHADALLTAAGPQDPWLGPSLVPSLSTPFVADRPRPPFHSK
jgi:hypothetical protein